MMMIVSVVLLIFTGLPVKFPDFVLSEKLIYLFGGIYNSTILHRIGAGGLIVAAIYHALYTVLSREGRRDLFLLLPRPKDLMDLVTQVRFFVGRSEEHARFGRFSYIEKFDYWAVYWGCIIMIGSGGHALVSGHHPALPAEVRARHRQRRPTPTRHSWPRWPSSSGTSTTCI